MNDNDTDEEELDDEEEWDDDEEWVDDWTVQDYLNQELEVYELNTEMNRYEKRAVRKWVASGHSVYEPCESKYLGEVPGCTTFLEVYRLDKKLEKDMKGMSRKEKAAYLAEYLDIDFGEPEVTPSEEDIRLQEAIEQTPEVIREKARMLYRAREWLWIYILSKEEFEAEEAHRFVDSHMKETALSEEEWWRYV